MKIYSVFIISNGSDNVTTLNRSKLNRYLGFKDGLFVHNTSLLTCIMFIALRSTCEQLRHGGAHGLRCASQILCTLFQLCKQQNTQINHWNQ